MNAVNKLLDKAKEKCSYASDIALAERIGVSRQQVSQWRKGLNPMSDDRVAQVAVIAKEPVAYWMVTIRAEQTDGPAAKAWTTLAQKLTSSAASVLLTAFVICALPLNSKASAHQNIEAAPTSDVYIMRNY